MGDSADVVAVDDPDVVAVDDEAEAVDATAAAIVYAVVEHVCKWFAVVGAVDVVTTVVGVAVDIVVVGEAVASAADAGAVVADAHCRC